MEGLDSLELAAGLDDDGVDVVPTGLESADVSLLPWGRKSDAVPARKTARSAARSAARKRVRLPNRPLVDARAWSEISAMRGEMKALRFLNDLQAWMWPRCLMMPQA